MSFGVALVEAMSSALPVVATRHNGFADTVEHGVTGILVSEHDVIGMAEAMAKTPRGPCSRDRHRSGRPCSPVAPAGALFVKDTPADRPRECSPATRGRKVNGSVPELFTTIFAIQCVPPGEPQHYRQRTADRNFGHVADARSAAARLALRRSALGIDVFA